MRSTVRCHKCKNTRQCGSCARKAARLRRESKIALGICVKCPRRAVKGAQFCKRHRDHKNNNVYKWRVKNAFAVLGYGDRHRLRAKLSAFNAYGGPVCACCGETTLEFLTIDHVDGNGAAHRRALKHLGVGWGNAFTGWLKKHEYPPGYRVLCMNCNHALGMRGYCPHAHGSHLDDVRRDIQARDKKKVRKRRDV